MTFGLFTLPSENLSLRVERRRVMPKLRGVAASLDRDHVEPDLAPRGGRHLGKILPRGADDPAPLGGSDRLLGRPEVGDLERADLDEDEHIPLSGDDVDLPALRPVVPLDDREPRPIEVAARPLLRRVPLRPARFRWKGQTTTPRNVLRWMGVGPSRRIASRCSRVGYPL